MRKPVVLGSLALAAALAPAHAGTVYVPLPHPQQNSTGRENVQYRTEVVVTNTGSAAGSVAAAYAGEDQPTAVTVPPKATYILKDIDSLNPNSTGPEDLLAISGDAEITVSARLVATVNSKVLGSTPVPAVSPSQLLAESALAVIQGVSRTSHTMGQSFGILNAGETAATCTAVAYRSTGTAVGNPVHLEVPARSQAGFNLPFQNLGTSFTDARAEVTCDQPFYAWGVQTGPQTGQAAFLAPAGPLETANASGTASAEGAANLAYPGTADTAGDAAATEADDSAAVQESTAGPIVGKDSLTFPGVFLAARRGASAKLFELPVRTGVRYRRIIVDFDLYLGKWQSPLFHAVTSLRRTDRTLYYGVILRGDRAKTIIDLGHEQMAKGAGPWKQNTQYHIRTVTDASTRTVTFRVFRGGTLVHTVIGKLVSADLSVPAGRKMTIDFGIGKVADGAYFPPIGWQYSNLAVKAEPY